MKLYKLHLFEERCHDCKDRLTADDIEYMKPGVQAYCKSCGERNDKKRDREDAEEQNTSERVSMTNDNLRSVSQQMPDRAYDKDRGTPGWLMGEPSPGRSF